MKLKNIGRVALATALSLAIGLGATACSRDYTAAYVYAVSKANGNIAAYAVDYQSGALTQISGSPFANSGGSNPIDTVPITVVASPSGKFIYVVNYAGSISVNAVGSDGKLYGQQTPSFSDASGNSLGSYPTSATIDSTGCYLYATLQLQAGFSSSSQGKGAVIIYPIISSSCQNGSGTEGNLGTPTVVPVGNNPVSVQVSLPYCSTAPAAGVVTNGACGSSGHYVVYAYVLDQESAPTPPTTAGQLNVPSTVPPQVLGFSQNMSNGKLTPLSGTTCSATQGTACTGIATGVGPSSLAIEPTTRFVYVTDALTNSIISYQINSNTDGNLSGIQGQGGNNNTATGQYPISSIVDPRGKYLLVVNYNSQTISSYAITVGTGLLSAVAGTSAAVLPAGPTCITIEPSLGIYVFTSNLLDGSISGEKMNANTGELTGIVNTPFPTSTLPSCITSVANGSHARSIVNP
jgi:6-phosphogluconolactonase